jgi:RluA family pseudouridine synthase
MTLSPAIVEEITLPPETNRQRLSDFRGLQWLPTRQGLKKAIKQGRVLVDGQLAKTGTWLSAGQKITVLASENKNVKKVFELNLKVLFEDNDIAVVWKPAGFPTSGNYFKTIENALPHNLMPSNAPDSLPQPRPVHRLDAPTTGLLLIAKTAGARISFGEAFMQKKIEKKYCAIVKKTLSPERGALTTPVADKAAYTDYEVAERTPALKWGEVSKLWLWPKTGRTHQLRIQLAEAGCPIIGDKLHDTESTITHKGLMLSAIGLSFAHPLTGEKVTLEEDPPHKFIAFLQREARRVALAHKKEEL